MNQHERPFRMSPEGKTPKPVRRKAAGVGHNSSNGGPVDTGRGFVLHSSDFFIKDATLNIDDDICLTATVDILKAIANGAGPKHAILALGYAGWAPGQLENEIQHNGWLHCDADPDLIFGRDVEEKYLRALRKIGIDPGMLSNEAGHA